jgi:hypothetical protein
VKVAGIRSRDHVVFGIDAVVAGLSAMLHDGGDDA